MSVPLPYPYLGGEYDPPKTLADLALKVQQNFEAVADKTPPSGRQTPLTARSTTQRDGTLSGDVVYQEATITLTAGSWMVFAQCSLLNLTVADAASVGLYNRTASAEVSDSRGAVCHTDTTIWGGASTMTVVTVSSNTDVCPFATRNGVSTLRVGSASGSAAGQIMAWRIGY